MYEPCLGYVTNTAVIVPDSCIVYEMKMLESGRIIKAGLYGMIKAICKSLDYFY